MIQTIAPLDMHLKKIWRQVLSRQWTVEIKHIEREANKVADSVTRHFKQSSCVLQWIEGPLAGVL